MDSSQYLGLFKLSSGALAFVTMLAGLREWGHRRVHNAAPSFEAEDIQWDGVDQLEIIDIVEETHDIRTFRLKRKSGKPFPEFNEGQFITFHIPHDGDFIQRSYSISSSTMNRLIVSVSIKKIHDGIGSSWFHERNVGDEVTAYTPNGLFTTVDDKYEGTPLVFVAGGIGITPFMSMLQSAVDVGSKTPMHLFYGMRSEKDMAFHRELEAMAVRYDNIYYHPILSEPSSDWQGDHGFIDYAYIASKVQGIQLAKLFFCGPAVMTDTVTEQLLANEIPASHIHSEKFASPVSLDLEAVPDVSAQVEFDGTSYEYTGKETLLEFLEAKGESINFACRVGVCGACKCRVESGEVDAFSDSGLTAEEKKAGYTLTCVARPKGDVKLKS